MNTSVVPRPPLAVIQIGSELETSLTRGWLTALAGRFRPYVFTNSVGLELLGGSVCTLCQASGGAIALARCGLQLRELNFAPTLALSRGCNSNLLAMLAGNPVMKAEANDGAMPSQIDASLRRCCAPLGVDSPERSEPIGLTAATTAVATAMLAEIGYDRRDALTLYAPASVSLLHDVPRSPLPVVLLPPGAETTALGKMAGNAYFLPAHDPALRAALIGNAGQLISDDPLSLELAALLRIKSASPQQALENTSERRRGFSRDSFLP
ncbi:MAG: hypothetical protein KJO55_09140 [Gammaproteobacteria bacterium]|nr:hypothetical protein [Gammaproteobacteria bacterium]NND59871.1 hypothetical protein [Gammaproteobacteria bacterium]